MKEFEGMEMPEEMESIEETESLSLDATKEADELIEQSMQEGISEFSADATKDTIADVMHEEGIPEEKIETLTEKGYELLNKEPAEQNVREEEEEIRGLKQTSGREGSPKPFNYPDKPEDVRKNMPWPSGKNTAQISQRERLEATKEGLEEFLETPHKTWQQEEAVTEKLGETEQQLSELPPDPPEEEKTEIEDVTDKQAQAEGWQDAKERKTWLEATQGYNEMIEKLPKEGKKQYIKDMYSTGIGFEGLGELMDDWDNTINDMGEMFD